MTALLTDEQIEDAAEEYLTTDEATHAPASEDFAAGARFARSIYEARLAEDAKVRAGLVEALILNVESCGCGMPKPCEWEEIAAIVADDPDNIDNYCDSCLGALAALAAAKERG